MAKRKRVKAPSPESERYSDYNVNLPAAGTKPVVESSESEHAMQSPEIGDEMVEQSEIEISPIEESEQKQTKSMVEREGLPITELEMP